MTSFPFFLRLHFSLHQLAFYHLVKFKYSLLVFNSLLAELYFSVEVSLHLCYHHFGNTFLVDDFSPFAVESGDFLGFLRDFVLFFPPFASSITLG